MPNPPMPDPFDGHEPERDVLTYVFVSIALDQQNQQSRENAMKKTNRVKTAAAEFVPASRLEVDAAIAQIGELQRQRETIQTEMNTALAAARTRFEDEAKPLGTAIKTLSHGVQVWCEANRADLTRDGKTKTVKLAAGEVRWRMRPPSVTVRTAGLVLEALKRLGLHRFIRTKEEVDKEAILANPDAVRDVKGISIGQGEDFVIVPFATELEEVA